AIKSLNCRIEEIGVSGDERVKLGERVGIKAGNAVENARLDVVQLCEIFELEIMIGGCPLPELPEVRPDFRTVIGFVAVGRDDNDTVPDQQLVADGGQFRSERRDIFQ